MEKFSYLTVDDVLDINNDRVCFYFGFNAKNVSFAAKKSESGITSHFKSENFLDVFVWLGFNTLSKALYSSAKFKKKYRLSLKAIVPDKLLVGTINDKPIFFFTAEDQEAWAWTENIADLTPGFGENIESLITQVLGSDYLKKYWEFDKENKAQNKAYEGYLMQKQEQIEAAKIAKTAKKEDLLATG